MCACAFGITIERRRRNEGGMDTRNRQPSFIIRLPQHAKEIQTQHNFSNVSMNPAYLGAELAAQQGQRRCIRSFISWSSVYNATPSPSGSDDPRWEWQLKTFSLSPLKPEYLAHPLAVAQLQELLSLDRLD
jgi:hypothetical protein